MARRRQQPPDEVHSITGAPRSHSSDLDQRMHRYLVSMGIRTVCVILAVVVHGPLRWVFIVGAVGLPYIAVVMANAGGGPRAAAPEAPGPGRPQPAAGALHDTPDTPEVRIVLPGAPVAPDARQSPGPAPDRPPPNGGNRPPTNV